MSQLCIGCAFFAGSTEEVILVDASASLGRAISWHELVSTLTILQARGLAQEYGFGAYVRN